MVISYTRSITQQPLLGAIVIFTMLGTIHFCIGVMQVKHGFADGGFVKTGLHSLAGGLYSAINGGNVTSGLLAGGVAEGLAPKLTLGNKEQQKTLTGITSVTSTLLSGKKDPQTLRTAADIGQSAAEYNSFMHPKPTMEEELYRQELLEKAGDKMVEYVTNHPDEALRITTDAASLILAGPSGLTAKRIAWQAVKTSAAKFFGNKPKVQPLIEPVTGTILDYSTLSLVEPSTTMLLPVVTNHTYLPGLPFVLLANPLNSGAGQVAKIKAESSGNIKTVKSTKELT